MALSCFVLSGGLQRKTKIDDDVRRQSEIVSSHLGFPLITEGRKSDDKDSLRSCVSKITRLQAMVLYDLRYYFKNSAVFSLLSTVLQSYCTVWYLYCCVLDLAASSLVQYVLYSNRYCCRADAIPVRC